MINGDRDFTIAHNSPIQGTGLFAKKVIPRGTRILEYAGQRIPKDNLAQDLAKGLTSLIYVMKLNDTTAIDGERSGNDARYINHSCTPNCEVLFFNETPYIYAMKEISPEEELSFDYKLGCDGASDISLEQKQALYPCKCGSENCRHRSNGCAVRERRSRRPERNTSEYSHSPSSRSDPCR